MKDIYNIVSCASFGSSGSGVITDYLSEYKSIKSMGSYEFRFTHDYMGIGTLEDALVTSPHRLNSDIAIQNFLQYVDRQCGNFIRPRYQKFFNYKWKEISLRYIDKLVDTQWPGYWEEYQITAPKLISLLKYQIWPKLKRLLDFHKKYIAHYMPTRPMYFSSPSEDKFLSCTREYINELCNILDPNYEYQYLMFDQIMPPTNISKYERYFDSIKTIVVDRDPRDYYITNVLKGGEKWVPADVEKFAILYRKHREQARQFQDSAHVLRIQYEDTIYHYNEFENQIKSFLNLKDEDHLNPRTKFNPGISIRNTILWEKRKVDLELIRHIEILLPEFLYDFQSAKKSFDKP